MTRDLVLLSGAVVVAFIGGAITWPVAHRAGVRAQLRDVADIERIEGAMTDLPAPTVGLVRQPTYHTETLPPVRGRYRGHRRITRMQELRDWWASTAPRDVDAPVRAALAWSEPEDGLVLQFADSSAFHPLRVEESVLLRLDPAWRERIEPIPVTRLFGQPTDLFAAVA